MSGDQRTWEKGYVYVATGKKYMDEAVTSAKSLADHNESGLPICVITDQDPPTGAFDIVIQIEKPAFGFVDKIQMWRAPFNKVIFLDTDVLVVGNLEELYECLDTHDIAARPEVSPGWDYKIEGIPNAFPEMTTGVIAFKKSVATEKFFKEWEETYYALCVRGERFLPDQPSFRVTLFRSNLRHCSIPPEWHLQADFGAYLYWDVKIVHCHEHQVARAKMANRLMGARAFHPLLGVFPLYFVGGSGLVKEWGRLSLQVISVIRSQIFEKIRRRFAGGLPRR